MTDKEYQDTEACRHFLVGAHIMRGWHAQIPQGSPSPRSGPVFLMFLNYIFCFFVTKYSCSVMFLVICLFLFIFLTAYMYKCMCVYIYMGMPYMDNCTDGYEWWSEDNFQELIISFQRGNSRDGTQVVRLGTTTHWATLLNFAFGEFCELFSWVPRLELGV